MNILQLEVTSRGEWVRLIPSLDGGIFRFDGEGVEALPVTAETLLQSSFKFNSETIFTGTGTQHLIRLRSYVVVLATHVRICTKNKWSHPAVHENFILTVAATLDKVEQHILPYAQNSS